MVNRRPLRLNWQGSALAIEQAAGHAREVGSRNAQYVDVSLGRSADYPLDWPRIDERLLPPDGSNGHLVSFLEGLQDSRNIV